MHDAVRNAKSSAVLKPCSPRKGRRFPQNLSASQRVVPFLLTFYVGKCIEDMNRPYIFQREVSEHNWGGIATARFNAIHEVKLNTVSMICRAKLFVATFVP